jgi:hypothetical protein
MEQQLRRSNSSRRKLFAAWARYSGLAHFDHFDSVKVGQFGGGGSTAGISNVNWFQFQ